MDENEIIIQMLEDTNLEDQAKRHWHDTESYQAALRNSYRRAHFYTYPPNGDQWPEDASLRPGMIHLTHNIIRPAVEVEARIESKMPRLTLQPESEEEDVRERAERAEKLLLRFLELSGIDTWLHDLNVTRGVYGKGILKVIWNEQDKRPDVQLIEQPGNLRLGYGSSDFTVLDWAMYEYKLSPLEVMRRYDNVRVEPTFGEEPLSVRVDLQGTDHSDPLNQIEGLVESPRNVVPTLAFTESDYEGKMVTFWDYWYKDASGDVWNAHLLNGTMVRKQRFSYYPDIPYIVIEFDHEPASPEGVGLVNSLIDIQYEMNRALSHFAQLVADEVDPAYVVFGENADSVPAGQLPKGGEMVAAGAGNDIKALQKGVNQFPIEALINSLYQAVHFETGLPEIMFSLPPGAQTAGRALQIQIEASANRLEQRRYRLYEGIRKLMLFWTFMLEQRNPKIPIGFDEDTGEALEEGVGDVVRGFRRWKMVAPEITPRDVLEQTTNVINMLQAKLIDLETAMDMLGVDSPLEVIEKIQAERSNPSLFPADAQQKLAVVGLMVQLIQQLQALGLDPAQLGLQLPVQGAQGPEAALAAQQAAAPQGIQGDNGESPPQPLTQEGSAPPPGAGTPGGLQNQTLIRSSAAGEGQVLNQIRTVTG